MEKVDPAQQTSTDSKASKARSQTRIFGRQSSGWTVPDQMRQVVQTNTLSQA